MQYEADIILKYGKLNFIEFIIIKGYNSSNYITMKILRNVYLNFFYIIAIIIISVRERLIYTLYC